MTQEHDDINDPLEDEISSWQSYSSVLTNGGEELFNQRLNECREYKDAINSKGRFIFNRRCVYVSDFRTAKVDQMFNG